MLEKLLIKTIKKKKLYDVFYNKKRIFIIKHILIQETKFWVFKPCILYVKSFKDISLKNGFEKIKTIIKDWKDNKFSKSKKEKSLKRKEIYPIELILPLIDEENSKINLDGDLVGASSIRLLTFKKNIKCVSCGIKGSFFAKEKTKNDVSYHLNLYASINGGERLMTHDHIIPKSKDGKDHISNSQTMCVKCNEKKGTLINVNLQVANFSFTSTFISK